MMAKDAIASRGLDDVCLHTFSLRDQNFRSEAVERLGYYKNSATFSELCEY